MLRPCNQNSYLGSFWTGILLVTALTSPIAAHTIKASDEVAATLHIQPYDQPKSGEVVEAWFALTRKGGTPILLKQCNCQLLIHPEGNSSSATRVDLKPISANQFQEIPGATIQFPQAGNYRLELSGAAKKAKDFKPFKLTYQVLVAAGNPSTAIPPAKAGASNAIDQHHHDETIESEQKQQSANPNQSSAASTSTRSRTNSPKLRWVGTGIALVIVSLGATSFTLQRLRKSN